MTTAQRILKNFLSLTTADIITKLLGIITVSYLARILGPADFGKINFALAIEGYFAILSHFGLNTIGTREIARFKEKINDYVNNILTLKICLGICAYLLLIIFVFLISKPQDIKYLTIIYGLTMFTTNVLLFDWVFQGIEKMEYIGLSQIITGLSYLGAILLFVKTSKQLLIIPWLLFSAQIIAVAFLISVFTKNFTLPKLKFELHFWKQLFKQAIPIGLTGIMTILILYSSTVLLGFIKTQEEVGYFSASYKIILMLILIGTAYATAIFPTISAYYKKSFKSFNNVSSYSLKLIWLVDMPLAITITILAPQIINLLYSNKYNNSILVLQILIWFVLITHSNTLFSHMLWATNKQNKVFTISTLQTTIVISSNIILIPYFGIIGACIGLLLAGIVAFLSYSYQIREIISTLVYKDLLKILFASLLMLLICFFNWSILQKIIFGLMIYLICLYFLKCVEKEDILLMLKTIRLKNENS